MHDECMNDGYHVMTRFKLERRHEAPALVWLIALASAVACDFGPQVTRQYCAWALGTIGSTLLVVLAKEAIYRTEAPGLWWRISQSAVAFGGSLLCMVLP